MLNLYFTKLGLTENSIRLKASELLRRLQMKLDNGGASFSLTENVRVIACIQLAAASEGTAIDKEQCIRLSGLRKAAYDKQVNVIESLLGLDTHMTVKEICVRAACSELIEFAEKLLQRYIESLSTSTFSGQPVYAAAAVMAVCKKHKFKVDKSLLLNLSRVKSQALNEVTKSMLQLADSMMENVKKATKRKRDDEEAKNKQVNKNQTQVVKNKEEIIEEEPYEVWKKRMLAED